MGRSDELESYLRLSCYDIIPKNNNFFFFLKKKKKGKVREERQGDISVAAEFHLSPLNDYRNGLSVSLKK